jgi:hypothetical protein
MEGDNKLMNNNLKGVIEVKGFASFDNGENSQTYIDLKSLASGENLNYDWDEILLDIEKPIRESSRQKIRYAAHNRCLNFLCSYDFFEPALFAVASTMFEGIIQGASYDLVKTYVVGGLHNLRAANLLRSRTNNRYQSDCKTEILFGWKSSSVNGHKRRNIHFSLKREYRWMSNHKRLGSLKSLQPRSRKAEKGK